MVNMASQQRHGTMLVFLKKPENERKWLEPAGFWLEKENDAGNYIERITSIDGAVLLDTQGKVHAIGIILDGQMPPEGKGFDMSRGARYNSAVKYSCLLASQTGENSQQQKHMIVVFSEDGYVDFIIGGET